MAGEEPVRAEERARRDRRAQRDGASWQQAQSGYAVLFTVRNQDGGCPWCQVEDVQFRGNLVRDVAAGMQILGTDPVHPSRQTNRIVVRDNVFDGIDREAWGGDGYFVLLSDAPRDITIDHNTIIQGASGGIVKIAHGVTERLTLTNNIAGARRLRHHRARPRCRQRQHRRRICRAR